MPHPKLNQTQPINKKRTAEEAQIQKPDIAIGNGKRLKLDPEIGQVPTSSAQQTSRVNFIERNKLQIQLFSNKQGQRDLSQNKGRPLAKDTEQKQNNQSSRIQLKPHREAQRGVSPADKENHITDERVLSEKMDKLAITQQDTQVRSNSCKVVVPSRLERLLAKSNQVKVQHEFLRKGASQQRTEN